ncbi:hypothetical protein BD410DRAFT_794754 [Rickenella mellea]|uniref:Uncharacterized protein n=1 Tax=Rickenella mellea TaxID=50990 RepID=A0A4Y7PQ23_9AGAM|nr:hypothetical protein BD410DRAFT_794754 [Rickenella mellea]
MTSTSRSLPPDVYAMLCMIRSDRSSSSQNARRRINRHCFVVNFYVCRCACRRCMYTHCEVWDFQEITGVRTSSSYRPRRRANSIESWRLVKITCQDQKNEGADAYSVFLLRLYLRGCDDLIGGAGIEAEAEDCVCSVCRSDQLLYIGG